MQYCIRITFILVNSILHLTKGQLLFNAIAGYGDWYGAETYMYPMRAFPSGCVHFPCFPWQNWKPEMFNGGVFDFREFNRNTDKQLSTFGDTLETTKKPKDKRGKTRKNSKKSEESDTELRVRDSVRGGRDKASIWQTLSPVSGSSGALSQTNPLQSTTDIDGTGSLGQIVPLQNQNVSNQRPYEETARPNITEISRLNLSFQDQVNFQKTAIERQVNPQVADIERQVNPQVTDIERQVNPQVRGIERQVYPQVTAITSQVGAQRTATEPHAADIKLNKTFVRESPLIQLYVIASGSGGAHTNIGDGGYHGKNNGQSNYETFHLKMKFKENLETQKDSINIAMGTAQHIQESRKRTPLIAEQGLEQNSDTEGGSSLQKGVKNTGEDNSNNSSDLQLNSEIEELKEQTEKAAARVNHEVTHKILGGTVKQEFQNHWFIRK